MPILFEFSDGPPSSGTLRSAAGNASIGFDSNQIISLGQFRGFGAVTPEDLDASQISGLQTAIESIMGTSIADTMSLDEALNRQYPDR